MQFGTPEAPTLKSNCSDTLHFPPTPGAELPSEAHDLADPAADSDSLDIPKRPDDFKVQSTPLLRQLSSGSEERMSRGSHWTTDTLCRCAACICLSSLGPSRQWGARLRSAGEQASAILGLGREDRDRGT